MAEQVHDLGLNGHIQRGDGLIRHQQLRLHGKRPGNGHPLALAAGQFIGVFIEITGVHAHIVQLELRFRPEGASGGPEMLNLHGLRNDLGHGHPLVQAGCGVLKNHLPPGLQELPIGPEGLRVADIDIMVENLPGGGPVNVHDAPGNGGFSGAGLPYQAENLPFFQLKGNIVHCLDFCVLCKTEGVGQMLHVQ